MRGHRSNSKNVTLLVIKENEKNKFECAGLKQREGNVSCVLIAKLNFAGPYFLASHPSPILLVMRNEVHRQAIA